MSPATTIAEVNIPTGVPRRYEFDDQLGVVTAEYLGDAEAIAAAAALLPRRPAADADRVVTADPRTPIYTLPNG